MIGEGCNPLNAKYVIVGPIVDTWRSNAFIYSKNIFENHKNLFELIYSSDIGNVYQFDARRT